MSGPIGRLDRALMRYSAQVRTPGRDRVLVLATRAANYSRLWLAIAGGLVLFGGGPGRRAARDGVMAIAIAASVANGPAKLLMRRRRPSAHESGPHLIVMPMSSSFPSGHSAAAFAFVTGACGQLPSLAPALAPLAGMVAYSRVHAGVHYPSDVLAGAAIGIGSGMIARRLAGRPQPRLTPREQGDVGR